MPGNAPSFQILSHGRWAPEQVQAHYDAIPHTLPSPHEQSSVQLWEQLLAAGELHLFNGQLFQFKSHRASLQRLELMLAHTCYRDQIYCNKNTPAFVQAHGLDALTRGLGVSAVVRSSDDHLPLMRRSSRVGEEPGKLDVFGGHAHPDRHLRNGQPDLFGAITEEIVTELNVPAQDITSKLCCGLVENLKTHKPDLVFLVQVRKTQAEIARAAPQALEAEEVSELLFLRTHEVRSFLRAHDRQFTPSALASLALWCALAAGQTEAE